MLKKMKYSLYKSSYFAFKADNYDAKTKTIEVELPEIIRPKFPKDWEKSGNRYRLPNGTSLYFWGSGFAENFRIERYMSAYQQYAEVINAGINARAEAIQKALEIDSI